MTEEIVWKDLHCHTLLKSNPSRDLLFPSVFMGKCQRGARLGGVTFSSAHSQSIFSLQRSAPVRLADR